MPPAIRTDQLTKDYAVGFWRTRPVPRPRPAVARHRAGRGLRLPRPERRRQDDDAEAADAADLPDARARATILGRPVGDVATRRRIGYLPENPYFYDYLTAEELLDVLRRPVRLSRPRSAGARVARCSTGSGIGAERRLQLRKFSKGMIQRVGIAQALLNDPEVVFLDEPMSGLDPLGRRDVRALILRAARSRAGRSSSARTSSPTPRRSAAASRSSRAAGWWRRAALARSWRSRSAAGSSWSTACRRTALARAAPLATPRRRDCRRAATRSSCRSTRRPSGCCRCCSRPARRSCRSTRCATRSRTSSCGRWRTRTPDASARRRAQD